MSFHGYINEYVLFNAATANGTSVTGTSPATTSPIADKFSRNYTFYLLATGVTLGATVNIQAMDPLGNWITLRSFTFVSNDSIAFPISATYFKQLQATISNYIDGAYSVSVTTSG